MIAESDAAASYGSDVLVFLGVLRKGSEECVQVDNLSESKAL